MQRPKVKKDSHQDSEGHLGESAGEGQVSSSASSGDSDKGDPIAPKGPLEHFSSLKSKESDASNSYGKNTNRLSNRSIFSNDRPGYRNSPHSFFLRPPEPASKRLERLLDLALTAHDSLLEAIFKMIFKLLKPGPNAEINLSLLHHRSNTSGLNALEIAACRNSMDAARNLRKMGCTTEDRALLVHLDQQLRNNHSPRPR